MTKNADIDKYKYCEYGIGFDRRGSFSHPRGGTGRNVILEIIGDTFGVGMSSSTKIDKRRKDVLILGKSPTQGLKHALSAEKMYSVLQSRINSSVWACIIMEQKVIYLLMVKKFIDSKQKILRL